jgi:hypothetical protein
MALPARTLSPEAIADESIDQALAPSASEQLASEPTYNLGSSNPINRLVGLGQGAIGAVNQQVRGVIRVGHEIVNGQYSQSFIDGSHNRRGYMSEDGLEVPLTCRIFNEQYLNNGLAYAYNFSLLVPAKHGAEIPTVADMVDYAAQHKRALIATTTDGYSNRLNREQLWSLTDFHNITKRRFGLYRSILEPGQELIVAGASLGGMLAYDMAATQEQEAEDSKHPLYIKKIIAICSAGHNPYDVLAFPEYIYQFTFQEAESAINYVVSADGLKAKSQRFFELLGTVPRHRQQLMASILIAAGIMKAPLIGVEENIPDYVEVIDETYGLDWITQPQLRAHNWSRTDHPSDKLKLIYKPGFRHLALLTEGRQTTLENIHDENDDPELWLAKPA